MMSSIGIFFIKVVSKLPFSVLYAFSWFLSNVIFKIIPYRKSVIEANLAGAFPEKSKKEIVSLRKRFYSFFNDLVVEAVKSFGISKKDLQKRIDFVNLDVAEDYLKKGKSVIIVMGHYGNWEWAWLGYALNSKYPCAGVYKPLHNKKFDNYFLKSRARFGGELISMNSTHEYVTTHIKKKAFTIGLISDQTPAPKKGYWLNFMNRGTPVFLGVEMMARQHDMVVIFLSLSSQRRGYYHANMQLITDIPKETPLGWITEQHTKLMEETIQNNPKYWLWTHKRWKHEIPVNLKANRISKNYPPSKTDKINY